MKYLLYWVGYTMSFITDFILWLLGEALSVFWFLDFKHFTPFSQSWFSSRKDGGSPYLLLSSFIWGALIGWCVIPSSKWSNLFFCAVGFCILVGICVTKEEDRKPKY